MKTYIAVLASCIALSGCAISNNPALSINEKYDCPGFDRCRNKLRWDSITFESWTQSPGKGVKWSVKSRFDLDENIVQVDIPFRGM